MLTLLFLSVNGHLILVDMLVKSYDAMPPGDAWMAPERLRDIAFFGRYAFAAGFLLALPVGFLPLFINLMVGSIFARVPVSNLLDGLAILLEKRCTRWHIISGR